MLKTLALLRHTKSSWNEPDISDFERPLSPRGRNAAPLMGHAMKKIEFHPELVICSPAKRTRQTIEMSNIEIETENILFDEDIYLASEKTLMEKIRVLPRDIGIVLIVGHNPGLHNLALHLIGHGNNDALKRIKAHFPTGSLAIIIFENKQWNDINSGSGELINFITPRDLEAQSFEKL